MERIEHDLGITYTVADEGMARSWHVLALDGDVWLIDPVDARPTLEDARALGTPRGVIQLLDRHARDCGPVARMLSVPHLRLPDALPHGPFEVVTVLNLRLWRERALWIESRRALVVAELIGTGPAYRLGGEPIGVHPMLRLVRPHGLDRYAADAKLLLCGHGEPVEGPETGAQIAAALADSRRRLPRALPALARMPRPFRRELP